MKCTILVVEDEPAIAELISVNLSFEGYSVRRASDSLQAEALIKAELPNLIIIDWMLPGTSGIQLVKKCRNVERTKCIPIIMLTARSTEEDKIDGLESGADDYVTKPFSPKELGARIKALLRRRSPELTDDAVTKCGICLNPTTHSITGNGKAIILGPTEFKLLHFFMTSPERIHSRGQILDKVWGDHVFVEDRTVDVHIRRLRKALSPTNHDKNIETIRGSGYRFATNPTKKN